MGVQSCPGTGFDRYAFDLKNDPSEIYEIYAKDPPCLLPALERLVAVKGYEEVLRILRSEHGNLLSDVNVYHRIVNAILDDAAEIRACDRLEPLVVFFIDLISVPKSPFQTFLVCRTVSSLIIKNSRFPSRAHTIKYFKYVSMLFKRAGSFYNYLNSLQILDSLESIKISAREFLFLRECASIKNEPGCKELFCGLKMVDLCKIFAGKDFAEEDDFVENANWRKLIDIKKTAQTTPFDVDFLSFLRKNSILFEIRHGEVHVKDYVHTGFATKIYNIVKAYEVKKPRDEPPVASVEKPSRKQEPDGPPPKSSAPVAGRPAPEFADRFSLPYKRFRWLYSHVSNTFVDGCFEERNRNRHAVFLQTSAAYEERKARYVERKDTIEQLSTLLTEKIKEKYEADYQKALENQRLEAERAKVERKAQMWNAKRTIVQNTAPQRPGASPVLSAEDSTTTQTSGDYLPPHLKNKNNFSSFKRPNDK